MVIEPNCHQLIWFRGRQKVREGETEGEGRQERVFEHQLLDKTPQRKIWSRVCLYLETDGDRTQLPSTNLVQGETEVLNTSCSTKLLNEKSGQECVCTWKSANTRTYGRGSF